MKNIIDILFVGKYIYDLVKSDKTVCLFVITTYCHPSQSESLEELDDSD